MPTDGRRDLDFALRSRRILRLAAGTALAVCVSQAGAWSLSFIAPILTLSLLSLPVSRPPPKFFIVVTAALVVSIYGAFILLPMLLHQPLAGLLLLSLALYHSFYFTARGGANIVGTLVTMGLTIMVAVGTVSVDMLLLVAQGASISALVGAAIAWLAHVALPDPDIPAAADQASPEPVATDPAIARRDAMRSLLIVLPVTVWFLLSSASASNVGVMVKVAAMGQEASVEQVRSASSSLLLSTVAGGIAALIGWQLLTIWPSLIMYVLLTGVAALIFGVKIFSGRGLHADGATWSYALLTMLVILAPAALDSQVGSAAGARFYDRLWMFMGASFYGVIAAFVFDVFIKPSPDREPAGNSAAGDRSGEKA